VEKSIKKQRGLLSILTEFGHLKQGFATHKLKNRTLEPALLISDLVLHFS
jgi:hypothetical protein